MRIFIYNILLFLAVIFLVVSCNSKSETQQTSIIKETENKVLNFDNFQTEQIIINNQIYFKLIDNNTFHGLIDSKENLIIPIKDYYHEMRILDIDKDNFQDIRVFAFSKTPNQCDNYLFDKVSQTFKLLKNCHLDIKQLNETNLYYSYYSTGCADMNWESELSKIKNYKLEIIGKIKTQNCDDGFKSIKIYSVKNEKETLLKNLPNQPFLIESKKNKFDFIKNHWQTSFSEF